MSELNFKITGDESELKRFLENVAKLQKQTNDQLAKDISSALNMEQKERKKAEKATPDQRKGSQDVVASINDEVKARATQAASDYGRAASDANLSILPFYVINPFYRL
ncbi:hypothetical protein [Pedobacter caeni]|uniref:Uncharacterized protein n=1 Tax=Pedobacter caeni TaxID=288992 RepID=A0A1M5IX39_9SPHI|nr:hypothetical protein [Pedobacter caeni]SHG32907.1 hypothetical protein SAMN04488522_105102 [Pedobacter caeni]